MPNFARPVAGARSTLAVLLLTLTIISPASSMDKLSDLTTPPTGTVSVSEFRPGARADTRSNITVTFTGDLVPSDSLNRPDADPPVVFEPAIPGLAAWIAPNVLRFYPDTTLRPATSYTARIRSDRVYQFDKRIVEPRTFEFETPRFAVLNVSSYTEPIPDNPGHVRPIAQVRFNYPVDPETLRDAIRITGIDSPAQRTLKPVEIRPLDQSETQSSLLIIICEPIPITRVRQTYRLEVQPALACIDCGLPLGDRFEATIAVEPQRQLVVERLDSYTEGVRGVIRLRLSTRVATRDAEEFLSIEPEVSYRIEQRYAELLLRAEFKPGETYIVTVGEGLPAENGALLEREFSSKVTIPDASPTVIFRANGIYLPRDGSGLLEMMTINVDTVVVEVEQIFANNLVYALAGSHVTVGQRGGRGTSLVGRRFYAMRRGLGSTRNSELATTIDVGAIIGDTARGIFNIAARNASRRWLSDNRLVMMTDIGILARMHGDYLMVWTNSLATTDPIAGAKVNLYSRNNQMLLTGITDSRGIAVFNDIATRVGDFDPYLITVTSGTDLAYLRFAETVIETSDFDVKGRPLLTGAYEAFLYFDRGVYRPGETAHIGSIVRADGGAAPGEFPYFVTVYDPSGRTFEKIRVATDGSGLQTVDLALPDFAPTGKYVVSARIGEDLEIGRGAFQVEEFMPDRIKVQVSTPTDAYLTGETVPVSVKGMFLFGPPAAGHQVTGHLSIEAHRWTPPGLKGFVFADDEREFARREMDLSPGELDSAGTFTWQQTIPVDLHPASALKGLLSASVSEQGGRAVNGYHEILIHPYRYYIGAQLKNDGFVGAGRPVSALLVAANRDGLQTDLDRAEVRLMRVVYNTVLTRDAAGRYRYRSERTYEPVDTLVTPIPDSGMTVTFTPPSRGRYRLTAHDPDGGHATAVEFYAGGRGYTPWAMDQPERIEIGLDRTEYTEGDNAVIQVRAPFGGKLLLTVEKDRVLEFMTIDMVDNTAEVTLPVRGNYFPNVYITATVIKKAADVDPSSPARAFGIAPLRLNRSRQDLKVDLTAPSVVRPRRPVTVAVNLGVAGESRITVAAVDAGILQLTDFNPPDPLEFFYGQKAPALRPYDIYSLLYPEIDQAESHLSPSGGRMFAASRKRHLNPISARRIKPVALWSGIVTTDRAGRAAVTFDLPEFNGQLVVMAVAVQGDRFGSASTEVTVRDNIVLQESFPRFITPNDLVDGLVTVHNNTDHRSPVKVRLQLDGPAELLSDPEQTVELGPRSEGQVVFRVKAQRQPGVLKCRLVARAGADSSEASFELANRPGQPLTTRYGAGSVGDNDSAAVDLPGGWVAGTDELLLQTSSLSAVQFRRNIDYLVRYPYGCVEQTTSRLFPLLYFNDLTRFVQPDLFGTRGPDYFVQEGIQKLAMMARNDGSFSFWPGNDRYHVWASVYAGHFLLEARAAGYTVDDRLYNRVLGHLKRVARTTHRHRSEIGARIYAAYALAQVHQLEKKVANTLKRLPLDALSIESKFLLAGALALSGDVSGAFEIIDPIEIQPLNFEPETGGNFSSGVRVNAIMLDVLTAVDPENPSAVVLARSLIDDARLGRWYTTQASAFALVALGKYLKDRPEADFVGTLAIAGDSTYRFDETDFRVRRRGIADRQLSIAIAGAGPCYYYWQVSGVPDDTAPREFARGIKVTRTYLDADGNQLDLGAVPLGAQVICRIEAEAEDRILHNVVINDLLPAALEIENPRLKTTPRLRWIPKNQAAVDYQDIRDDRLLVFTDLLPKRPMEFYYSLRVIAAGEFVVPPIAAECMYNPLIAGAGSSGLMTVVGKTK